MFSAPYSDWGGVSDGLVAMWGNRKFILRRPGGRYRSAGRSPRCSELPGVAQRRIGMRTYVYPGSCEPRITPGPTSSVRPISMVSPGVWAFSTSIR